MYGTLIMSVSDQSPFCTFQASRVAVNTFVTDPTANMVSFVTSGEFGSSSKCPKWNVDPPAGPTTATATPGTVIPSPTSRKHLTALLIQCLNVSPGSVSSTLTPLSSAMAPAPVS